MYIPQKCIQMKWDECINLFLHILVLLMTWTAIRVVRIRARIFGLLKDLSSMSNYHVMLLSNPLNFLHLCSSTQDHYYMLIDTSCVDMIGHYFELTCWSAIAIHCISFDTSFEYLYFFSFEFKTCMIKCETKYFIHILLIFFSPKTTHLQ